MLKLVPAAFANALAATSAICMIVGAAVAALLPGLYLALLQDWLMIALAGPSAGGVVVTLSGFVIGLVTLVIVVWLFGFVLAILFNAFGAGGPERR